MQRIWPGSAAAAVSAVSHLENKDARAERKSM